MKTKAHSVAASLIVLVIVCGATGFFPGAARADSLLTGTVTSAAGEKMGGVTVSAKAEGSTVATSVFTDESGNYYFPPLPNGKYRVWAQALTYERADGSTELKKKDAPRFRPAADQKPGGLDSPIARR